MTNDNKLNPSLADTALYGHYAKLLHSIRQTVDRLTAPVGIDWQPFLTEFQIGLPVDPQPADTPKGMVAYEIRGLCFSRLENKSIWEESEYGAETLKADHQMMLYALGRAFIDAEQGLDAIVHKLAIHVFGEEYAREVANAATICRQARLDKIAEHVRTIEASKTNEQKVAEEAKEKKKLRAGKSLNNSVTLKYCGGLLNS